MQEKSGNSQRDRQAKVTNGEPASLKQMIDDVMFRPRVLVVDDELRIRDACSRMLVQEGCDVRTADNGSKGLEMIQQSHFDIVLLDLMMPGLSGIDVGGDHHRGRILELDAFGIHPNA